MFSNLSSYGLMAIKIYGLSSICNELLLGLIGRLDGDFLSLSTSLTIEGLFIFMKTYEIAFPHWMEVIQDLC